LSDKRSPDSIKGLPFDIKIPNDETLAAMSEAEQLNGDFVSIDDFVK
jgi:antitoxin component of RelBE/YafQ-DinJ toxin-antitoxin module